LPSVYSSPNSTITALSSAGLLLLLSIEEGGHKFKSHMLNVYWPSNSSDVNVIASKNDLVSYFSSVISILGSS
jgi:hypothetical protein